MPIVRCTLMLFDKQIWTGARDLLTKVDVGSWQCRRLFAAGYTRRGDNGRVHLLEVTLDETYPRCPPPISADVCYNFNLEWSPNSKLRDVVHQFQRHVDKLQHFWSTLDDIDQSLWVIDPQHSRHAMSYRQIKIGDDCCIILSIDVKDPLSLPEAKDKLFPKNLAHVFDTKLLQPPRIQNNKEQVECGICYAQYLPIDNELGAKRGSATDYKCENGHCNQLSIVFVLAIGSAPSQQQGTFHRGSFDVLFGSCPYCSDSIAVEISSKK